MNFKKILLHWNNFPAFRGLPQGANINIFFKVKPIIVIMWPNEQKPSYGFYLKTKIENKTDWRHDPSKSLEKQLLVE